MSDKRDLTTGSVRYQLIRLASPLTFGIISLFVVAIVEIYFVGRLGIQSLAAISFAFPVAFVMTSLSIGLAAGTASVLSRAIGGGDRSQIVSRATHSLLLAFSLGIFIGFLGTLIVRPLFELIGARGGVLDDIEIYMQIFFYSMPMFVLSQVSGSILRANGDALFPSAMMAVASAVNLALIPLFVNGGFGIEPMGIAGSAWAAFCSRLVMPLIIIPVLIFRYRLVSLSRTSWSAITESWGEIVRIGVPAALGNAINPIGISIVTGILAVYGNEVVAGFGVAGRLEAFATIPMLALSGSIGPLAGQNWGAGEYSRVAQGLRFAFLICLAWSVVMALFFWVFGDWIVSLFSAAEIVETEAQRYLWIVPITTAGYGITIVAAATFNALGRPLLGLGIYMIRTLAFYIPIAFVATALFNTTGVFVGLGIANVLAGVVIFWLALRLLKGLTDQAAES